MEKGIRSYGDTARSIFRNVYPCVDGKPDSTEFKKSLDSIRKYLADTASKISKASADRVKEIRDSMIRAQVASGDDCSTLLAQATDYIAQSNVTRDSLKWELDSEKSMRRKLAAYINSIKPVIQPVKDSSEIKDAQVLQAKAEKERDLAIAGRDHYKKLWDEEQDRRKGSIFVLYFKWWWFVIAMLIGAAVVKWKNIVGLLKKGISFLRF